MRANDSHPVERREYKAMIQAAYRQVGARRAELKSLISESWLESFENFFSDMGPCPAGALLRKVDPKGPFYKGNCQWL